MPRVSTALGPHWILCFYWSVTLESPPSSFSFVYSLFSPLSSFLSHSLVLSLTFILELKCTESASVWLTHTMQYNTIKYNTIQYDTIQYNTIINRLNIYSSQTEWNTVKT